MSDEFHRKYRPTTLKAVVGQDEAVATLTKHFGAASVPQTMLFTGPSGCGKTTLARVVARRLKCGDYDLTDLNAADFKGIDMVREIRRKAPLAPMSGRCRVWIVDECHKLTNDAQNAFLKVIEEPPPQVYFFFATTDPEKLLKTFRNRCVTIALNSISETHLSSLVSSICEKEGITLSETVRLKLLEAAGGSARRVVILLGQIAPLSTDEERLSSIADPESEEVAFAIAQALFNPKAKWPTISKLIKGLKEEDWEGIRYMILSYASKVCLGGGPMAKKAYLVLDRFRDNWYDCKRAGLVAACWEVVHA